ncbi:ABC transporter permease [Streptomyces sp. Q6]|uniref:ABC transporter permease n=1 Tax=Streptomyces citrinus TaxID=3118173 RepID=A0ACD5AD63_9ACTN
MSTALLSPSTGLNWTVLRLHRGALWLWCAYVAVAAGLLLWAWGPGTAGLGVTGHCSSLVANACAAKGPTADAYHYVLLTVDTFLTLLPLAVAVFASGTLIGRELESGTAHLAWTQSVSPTRWLMAKLVLPALALTLGTGILVLLRRAVAAQQPDLADNRWFSFSDNFEVLGPIVVALPLLGLACGTLGALLRRRMLAGAGVGFVLTLLLWQTAGYLSPHLWPTKTVVGTVAQGNLPFAGVTMGDGAVTASGAHIADPFCGDDTACLTDHHITGYYTEGHPPSHFWPLQLVETGLLLGAAGVITLIVFRVLSRRVGS